MNEESLGSIFIRACLINNFVLAYFSVSALFWECLQN